MVLEMSLEERLEAGGRREVGVSLGQRRPNSAEARDRSSGPAAAALSLPFREKNKEAKQIMEGGHKNKVC